jgi:hypothetical protein
MAGLLQDFVDEAADLSTDPLIPDDGQPLQDQDDGYDESPLTPARNSMQAAQDISDQHQEAYKNLTDSDKTWSNYAAADKANWSNNSDGSKMRDLTPTQRFNISTGLIDGRAPNAPNSRPMGFTPQNDWDNQFSRQMKIPQSTHGFRPDPITRRNPEDAGYKTSGQISNVTNVQTPQTTSPTSTNSALPGVTISPGNGSSYPQASYATNQKGVIVGSSNYSPSPHTFTSPI